MSDFQQKILNQMSMNYGQVVQEIPCGRDGYRAWIQIIPPSPSRSRDITEQNYIVSIFNLEQPIISDDDWKFEPYMMGEQEDFELDSLEKVRAFLTDRNIDLRKFVEPWNTNFPF